MSIEARVATFRRRPIIGMMLIVLASMSSAFPQTASADRNLCYVFLQDGQIRLSCGSKHESIHLGTRLLDFAISRDDSYAAFELENPHNKYVVRTVSLEKGSLSDEKMMSDRLLLRSTCGGVIGIDIVTDTRWNLAKWNRDMFYDYKYFMCSSDRQVTAGWTASDEASSHSQDNPFRSVLLHVNRHGKNAEWPIEDPLEFDVSQNGSYIAYFSRVGNDPKLCVRDNTSEKCVDGQGGGIALANSGDVLYVSEEGLKYWHPGSTVLVTLSEPGNIQSPQWITPEVAQWLLKWPAKNLSIAKPQ